MTLPPTTISGAIAEFPEIPQDQINKLMQRFNLPEIVARLLISYEIDFESIEAFLNPSLKRDFPDPFSLRDMEGLSYYIANAIVQNKPIAVFGDFDVDGATSASLLYRFLRHFDIKSEIYIPDRMSEGYGPNVDAFNYLKEKGYEIVILCDCGIVGYDSLSYAKSIGIETVVLDHHEAGDKLPDAKFVIDPKRKDDNSGLDNLAAVGVTFLACVAINNKLRKSGYFSERGIQEPDLRKSLDLVALGTICDMVSLTGANRIFVRFGLREMQNTENIGLKALIERAGIKDKISAYHCGYMLGPRINAGSRINKSSLGAVLLASNDSEEVTNISFTLEDCNNKRKEIQNEMFAQACKAVESPALQDIPVIFADNENWHPGLAGLVAGNLKEKYNKPAFVVTYAETYDENGNKVKEGRGSGRSIQGFNIAHAIHLAKEKGILIKGGGHAMAGGFALPNANINQFREFLIENYHSQIKGDAPPIITKIAGMMSIGGLQVKIVEMIEENIGPFGVDHEEPLFCLQDVTIKKADILNGGHIKLSVSDREGGKRANGIAFRAKDTPLGDFLLQNSTANGFGKKENTINLITKLKINSWNNQRNVQIHVIDALPE